MKTVCIYHSIDLDGWMSAAIVKHWYVRVYKSFIQQDIKKIEDSIVSTGDFTHEKIDFLGYNYGQPVPDLSLYDKVIMCDISFPKEDMLNLYKRLDINFIWIDHHISAIKDNGKLDEYNIEDISTLYNGSRRTDYAACELTWLSFFPDEPMPEIVRLLGRYDCFGHKGTDEDQKVLEFQYGARSYIDNYKRAYEFLTCDIRTKGDYTRLIQDCGKSIYNYLCTDAKQSYKNGFEINFNELNRTNKEEELKPLRFICINKERFNPINFGIDYHKDGYDGVACFYFDGNKWSFSLYNDNGLVDCSAIAKQYGGGGHKGAAGFRLDTLNDIL